MIRKIILLLLVVASSVAAQSPEHVADEALKQWLAQPAVAADQLFGMTPEQICQELPKLFQLGAPLPGTEVNMADRLRHETEHEHELLFTYPASSAGDRYDIIEVVVSQHDGTWQAGTVSYRAGLNEDPVRSWMQTPTASLLFSVFSVLVLWLLFSPGKNILKTLLQQAGAVIKLHRRLVIISMVVLYGAFAFGAFLGSGLPAQCVDAVMGVLQQALTQVGATEAYGSGNIPRAATLTFYQNFGMVTLSVLFPLAMLFGVPGYLFTLVSFTAQGIPFGFISGAGPVELLTMGVVLVLELTAYFLITAGGGILLATVFRHGFRAFPLGFRKLLALLPVSLILLLVGAWFEATMLLL